MLDAFYLFLEQEEPFFLQKNPTNYKAILRIRKQQREVMSMVKKEVSNSQDSNFRNRRTAASIDYGGQRNQGMQLKSMEVQQCNLPSQVFKKQIQNLESEVRKSQALDKEQKKRIDLHNQLTALATSDKSRYRRILKAYNIKGVDIPHNNQDNPILQEVDVQLPTLNYQIQSNINRSANNSVNRLFRDNYSTKNGQLTPAPIQQAQSQDNSDSENAKEDRKFKTIAQVVYDTQRSKLKYEATNLPKFASLSQQKRHDQRDMILAQSMQVESFRTPVLSPLSLIHANDFKYGRQFQQVKPLNLQYERFSNKQEMRFQSLDFQSQNRRYENIYNTSAPKSKVANDPGRKFESERVYRTIQQ